ncbi:unnamed protein product [Protopolystoma xenopodis]|uniref:Uncharacterized protein n=1 Tax=Protopolystoma xenopodis TaxID=117903 RepID=A0A3S5CCX6_9PLAT|nr:unnamed protein product [Protopolystoma xenopodis]
MPGFAVIPIQADFLSNMCLQMSMRHSTFGPMISLFLFSLLMSIIDSSEHSQSHVVGSKSDSIHPFSLYPETSPISCSASIRYDSPEVDLIDRDYVFLDPEEIVASHYDPESGRHFPVTRHQMLADSDLAAPPHDSQLFPATMLDKLAAHCDDPLPSYWEFIDKVSIAFVEMGFNFTRYPYSSTFYVRLLRALRVDFMLLSLGVGVIFTITRYLFAAWILKVSLNVIFRYGLTLYFFLSKGLITLYIYLEVLFKICIRLRRIAIQVCFIL